MAGERKALLTMESELEHILLQADKYIGSVEKRTQTLWVYEKKKMIQRPVTYVPGLYKIFDKNFPNGQRMDSVMVNVDVKSNSVSVFYTGDVHIHQQKGAKLTNIFSSQFVVETADESCAGQPYEHDLNALEVKLKESNYPTERYAAFRRSQHAKKKSPATKV